MKRMVIFLALVLCAACAPAAPTSTPTPTASPADFGTSEVTPTPGPFVATVAAGAVRAAADDAVAFVLERGVENVTAQQLTAALLGVLGRLRDWTEGTGGETAPADCRALLPGVIARADNRDALTALLRACESEDAQQVGAALEEFGGMVP